MQAKIKALEARVAITEDLEGQVRQLREQLASMTCTNKQLELALEQITR